MDAMGAAMPDLSTLKSREFLGDWLNQNGLVGEGVEVGVLSGGNARQIMSQWQGRVLHLVDPWCRIDPAIYKEKQDWPVDVCMRECEKLRDQYPDRIRLHRMFSVDAAQYFPDLSLDFVYLDGNHSYEAVTEDLNEWWDKVKTGGLFSGHDYRNEIGNGQHCEVRRAVDDWRKGYPLHYTNVRISHDPGWCGSWWMIKP